MLKTSCDYCFIIWINSQPSAMSGCETQSESQSEVKCACTENEFNSYVSVSVINFIEGKVG